MSATLLTGATIVTPDGTLDGLALRIADGRIAEIASHPEEGTAETIDLGGGYLLPGFIDTQVNGGGGVLFNDAPDVETIARIAQAHRRHGTTGLLPTFISDDLANVERAMDAIDAAIEQGVPGVLGIHIEGPFINVERRGIHEARFMRSLDDAAMALLTRPGRGKRLVTLAPECAPPGAIRALRQAGVIVAAGHSMADYATTRRALDEGLDGFTHLFNAMTPFGSREPGMVGAALEDRASRFGLIVDGHHVHAAAMTIAVRARGIDGVMLVTDAMPPVGGNLPGFTLMGREIHMVDGICRGPDGTLAGSALTMAEAFRNAMDWIGLSLVEASRAASGNPAAFLGLADRTGAIAPGLAADLVHLGKDRRVTRTWIGGEVSALGE